MAVQDYKINYKSDFVLNINGDAGWAIPFCIKFWTGMPSQAYFVGFDGVKYVNCRVGDTPTQLLVMFDDHHLPIGPLKMQIAYHTTIEEFPGSVFDEVTNARDVIVTIDGTDYQVLLDFTGEDAPELEFDLPAYANEAERIQNELQRQQNEAARIAAELQREQDTATAVEGAENVNAQLNGTTLTVTNRQGVSTSVNTKGEQGAQGPVGPEGPQGEQGVSIVDFRPVYASETATYYVITFSDGHEQSVAIPKGAKGDPGATGPTGPQGPQGQTGVSITDFFETGETETDTLYDIEFSDGTTKPVAIPKGEKGDQGEQGNSGYTGAAGELEVVNNLTQGGATAALSAEMGMVLAQGQKILDGQVILSTSFTWTASKYIAGTGSAGQQLGAEVSSSSSSSRSSGYVDVSKYSKIEITLPRFGNAGASPGACFYDENHVAISGMWKAGETPANTYGTYTFDVPQGAQYVRATSRTDFGTFVCIGYIEVSISESISKHDVKETDISSDFIFAASKTFVSQVDGTIRTSSSTNSFASNKVYVDNYQRLRVKVPVINTAFSQAGWAFYDGAGNYLCGCAIADAEAGSITMVEKILNVPRNAQYFASTWRKDNGATFYCYGIEEAQDYSYGEIANTVSEYEGLYASVKDFGCIGDGIADDTHAFILALASGVKKLYIPAGTYNIGQTLTIPDGMELCGGGIGSAILHFMKINNNSKGNENIPNVYTPYTWRVYPLYTLVHVSGNNVYLHDFEMEAYEIDTINYQFVGISFYGSTNSKMENVYVHDINYRVDHGLNPSLSTIGCHGYNIYIWNNSKEILIDHCVGNNGGYENIGTEDAEDVTISNSYWGTGWRTSLQIHRGSKKIRVVNNTINNYNPTIAHASLTIHGIVENPIEDLFITNNTIISITDENQGLRGGIELVQSGYQNVFITGNSMDGNSYAIVDLLNDGESASWPNNLFFINNRVKNSRYGICLKRGNNYIVKDNVIDTENTAIEMKVTRYICKDNILVDNTTKTLSGTQWVDS